jgi:hypothetical protein
MPVPARSTSRRCAAVDLEALRGRICFGGLDLSTITDVAALAWVFPPEQDDGLWRVLSHYFVPEENLRKGAERDRVPYDLWTRQSFIEATEGYVVDYGDSGSPGDPDDAVQRLVELHSQENGAGDRDGRSAQGESSRNVGRCKQAEVKRPSTGAAVQFILARCTPDAAVAG